MKYKPINIRRIVDGLFTKRSEFFPVPSVHEEWVRNRIPRGAHYDSADDGPEVELIQSLALDAWWERSGRESIKLAIDFVVGYQAALNMLHGPIEILEHGRE